MYYEFILRYGAAIYTCCPIYVLNSIKFIQRIILKYLFRREEGTIQCCETPTQLSKLIDLSQNFFILDFRKQTVHNCHIRQNFKPEFAGTKHGEIKVGHRVPKLLNKYCTHSIKKENTLDVGT